MIGRLDLRTRPCSICSGSGQDPKKRKRKCPYCVGSGLESYCQSCGDLMPCLGSLKVMDQAYCANRGN